jgi:hypothetical protein
LLRLQVWRENSRSQVIPIVQCRVRSSLSGGTKESGRVDYSYTSRDLNALPDILRKRVDPYTDPLNSALRSFSLKVLSYQAGTNPVNPQALAAATRNASYVISNGVPLTRVGGSFLPRGTGTTRPFGLERPLSQSRIRLIVGVLACVSLSIVFFVVYQSIKRKEKSE